MAKKELGGKSSQQNDFLEPKVPTVQSVTDVGTNRVFSDGAATVSFTLAGDSPPATGYTVTATAAGQTTRTANGSISPLTVVGLASGVTYSVTMIASNAAGNSASTTPVNVTATTVPGKPGAPSVGTQVNQDNVSWSAPATGGKTISNYQWESNDAKGNTTTSTSVPVAQEGGTAQAYRVRAYNANGWGEWSDWSGTVTTTPPFFPFFPPFFPWFPPYFPWFPYFPFFPWFPPFFPWFPPFFPPRFPSFNPRCIAADTLVMTTDGPVKAKDLSIGVTLLTYKLDELSPDDEHEMFNWSSDTLTVSDKNVVETVATLIVEKASAIIKFNDNDEARYSTTQPVFVKIDGTYYIRTTGSLAEGDILVAISEDGTLTEEEITSITIEDVDNTYQISAEPYDWFIAGGYLVHNK